MCRKLSQHNLCAAVAVKIVHKMLFEERKKWNSLVGSRGVAAERNDKKHS